MTDSLSPERRSENMRRIRSTDSAPEMVIRRAVHRTGYRYRLHAADLPGKPDLVFPRSKRIIEVRGCFWHQHGKCIDSHIPKSRSDYWVPKLAKNKQRDRKTDRQLRRLGWQLLVLWECEAADSSKLLKRLKAFLRE